MTFEIPQHENPAQIQRVSDAAKEIIQQCPWDNTVNWILDYDNDDKTIESVTNVHDWLNVVKATGGTTGIAWYYHDVGAVTEFNLFKPSRDSSTRLQQLVIDSHTFLPNDAPSDWRIDGDDSPACREVIGDDILDKKYRQDSITPILVSVSEICNHIPVTERQSLQLSLITCPGRELFTHLNPRWKHWSEIDSFTPVTSPAMEILQHVPGLHGIKNEFISYATANNPEDFEPSTEAYYEILRVSAGQFLIGWYDCTAEQITGLMYYDYQTRSDDVVTEKPLLLYYTCEDETTTTNTVAIEQQITSEDVRPMLISLYSTNYNTHSQHNELIQSP